MATITAVVTGIKIQQVFVSASKETDTFPGKVERSDEQEIREVRCYRLSPSDEFITDGQGQTGIG